MVWKPIYILLIILSTVIDYYCSNKIGSISDKKKSFPFLIVSIVSNLLILITFKYYNFFNEAAFDLANLLGIEYAIPMLNVLLPMGISFYTFQTMSYSIDVYRGVIKPEKHLGVFALYVTFFPQLVAGPIEKAKELLPQFHFNYEFSKERLFSGVRLILWGLFKKIVIADQLSIMVSYVFDKPDNVNGFSVVFGLVLFTQQIYCDFSGYSDIAQGSARVLGVRLMDNFKYPLYAKSIDDLWRRWHVSLMQWFKDYLYIPLGGSKKGVSRKFINLFIVFAISGLWHGSNWTFILWGLFNGLFVIYSRFSASYREKLAIRFKLNKIPRFRYILQVAGSISFFSFTWIFFLSDSVKQSIVLIKKMFFDWASFIPAILNNEFGGRQQILYLGKEFEPFILIMFFMVIFEVMQWKISKSSLDKFFIKKPRWKAWSIYFFILFAIIFMSNIEKAPFIYFQF